MRNSNQRNLIIDIVKGCKDHPTADVVYARARQIKPDISLGTVYRNLSQLASRGEVLTIESVEKRIHYDGDTSKHQHFICLKCGCVLDVFEEVRVPEVLADNGAIVTESKCVFYGVCQKCRDNK